MNFTHLHVHSHYSLLDGLSKIDDLLDYTKELGMDSIAVTDHGVLYAAVEFYQKAKKQGIHPIIGCEAYVALDDMTQRRPNIDDKRYHLILLAQNDIGYRNLVKLVSEAHLKGFYYKPRIDEAMLEKYSEGLVGLSACVQGKVARLIISNKEEQAAETAKKYKRIFRNNFFLEIQNHPSVDGQDKANKALIDFSKKLDIPLVATNDSHYLRKDDAEAQDILMLINTGAKRDDKERKSMLTDDYSLKSPKEMAEFCKEVPQAIENTQRIKEMCNYDFTLGETKLPYFKTPKAESTDDYIRELCQKGLEEKKKDFKDIKEAQKRLDYELGVIQKMGYSSYFLIVQDFVNWAKEKRIVVGPGRGSAAGSIVSYLLNITEVEPLKYGLLFERFLNPARVSMPDIDLDFADKRRDEVIEYVSEKYGRDHVAQIITFGTMASRAAIRDTGRALGLDYSFCDKIAKLIPFNHTLQDSIDNVAEFRQLYNTDAEAKELIDYAKQLEGCCRHASTHACGVVISKDPLNDLVPVQLPSKDANAVVTQYEMHAIEDLGLLKMDFLGLKNLTIIEDTLARIYKVRGKSLSISDIPFDDKKALKLFQEARTTSVFQLESDGMKRYLKDLKPTCFDDIATMIALYRPGPMELIPEYIQRKHGKKAVEYIHPSLEPVLKSTYGLPVFQEQIMQIATTLAKFTLPEADTLRKAIGKKIKELLDAQKVKFIEGCIKNNVSKEVAEKVFSWIEPHAQYSFNKSHAVAYAMISFKTAYLKANYPVEFMSAALTSEKNDVDRISFLIEECKSMGVEVLPPDINESFHNFSVIPKEEKIRFGLLAIKNVGGNIVTAIITERKEQGPFKSFSEFVERINSKDFNKKSLENLIKAGVFDKFEERNKLLSNIEGILGFNREIRKAKTSNQTSLFDIVKTSSPILSLGEAQKINQDEILRWEKELLGLYVSSHPLERVREILQRRATPIKELKEQLYTSNVRIGGIISSIKKILTKKGQPMLFMKVEDLTDKVEVVVFPSVLESHQEVLQENKMVLISGKKDQRDGEMKILASLIEEIIEV